MAIVPWLFGERGPEPNRRLCYAAALLVRAVTVGNQALINQAGGLLGFAQGEGSALPFPDERGVPIMPDGWFLQDEAGCVIAFANNASFAAELQLASFQPLAGGGIFVPNWVGVYYHNDRGGIFAALRSVLQNLDKSTPILLTGHGRAGAWAMFASVFIARELGFTNVYVLTLGSPKVGSFQFAQRVENNVREVTELQVAGDILPSCPPALPVVNGLAVWVWWWFYSFVYVTEPWFIDADGTLSQRWAGISEQAGVIVYPAWAGDLTGLDPTILQSLDNFHRLDTYSQRLLAVLAAGGLPAEAIAWRDLELAIDAFEAGRPAPVRAQLAQLPGALAALALMNAATQAEPSSDELVPIPADGVQRFVSTSSPVSAAGNATSFDTTISTPAPFSAFISDILPAGPKRPRYLFADQDRRLLEKIDQVFTAIARRDSRAADPSPTSMISTRELIIDPDDASSSEAFALLRSQVQALLALERSAG